MIKILFLFSFFFILSANEKMLNDTLSFPKLDLRNSTFVFDSHIDLTKFFEEQRSHNFLTDEQIEIIKQKAKNYEVKKVQSNEIIVMETSHGIMKFKLFVDIAPENCLNFKKLANSGFYDETFFHRIIPDFIIQGGDILSRDSNKNNDGLGNPGWTVKAEFNDKRHIRGTLSMHRIKNDINSAGSQFFISLSENQNFDNKYTIIGEIVDNIHVLDIMENLQSESVIALRMLNKQIPISEDPENWERITYNNQKYFVKIPKGQNKENYLKILFDRIENTNRPHAAVKIKSVRVVKPNDNL